jgi:hypothetical protein
LLEGFHVYRVMPHDDAKNNETNKANKAA